LARLTTGLDAHSFTLTADGRRVAYALLTETANVWWLPVVGAAVARPEQVTFGQQTVSNIVVSHDGAWLYYDSDLAGNSDLYRTRLPTGTPERLTADMTSEFAPAPSPDGREVAFHSIRGGSRNVYSLPLDGGALQTVVAAPMQEGLARWSPDGRTLAFSELQVGGGLYLTTRDAEGRWSAPRRIAQGLYVRWSPGGPRLSFIDQLFGGSVFVINADGSALRRVFDGTQPGGARAVATAWSEDGRDIYVKASNAAGNTEVWAVAAQGGEPRRLTVLGDTRRRSDQYDLDVARARIYFALKELESDVWVIDVAPR
jgi:Tol biopolymer transport system component